MSAHKAIRIPSNIPSKFISRKPSCLTSQTLLTLSAIANKNINGNVTTEKNPTADSVYLKDEYVSRNGIPVQIE